MFSNDYKQVTSHYLLLNGPRESVPYEMYIVNTLHGYASAPSDGSFCSSVQFFNAGETYKGKLLTQNSSV